MEFKDKVYQARMRLGLSQEAFAKELKVGIASINRWENGATKPNKLKEYAFTQFCESRGIIFKD